MLSPISSANDASPAETRRGRAWIDRTAGVRIGYTLAGSPWMSPDLVPDAGHWVAEENPDYFCRRFIEFDSSAEPHS
jgi:pimeloyl-ACP methyl ester carboxylesterase